MSAETARLAMEPLTRAHAAALFPLLGDERIYRYIPQNPPPSPEALAERYARLEARRSPDGREAWLNWAVRLRGEARYVGRLEATVREDGTALVAYELSPEFWGHGYAAEGVAWLLGELSNGAGVREVLAHVDTRNRASIRLLERLGFERVAHTPGADFFKGASSDEYTYRWAASEPSGH